MEKSQGVISKMKQCRIVVFLSYILFVLDCGKLDTCEKCPCYEDLLYLMSSICLDLGENGFVTEKVDIHNVFLV